MATQMQSLERLFQALADGTRLRIVGLLLQGEVCVCHLHESLGIPQPKASRHLAYLRRAGLVEARRDGLWMHYRLADDRDPAVKMVVQAVKRALGQQEIVQRDTAALSKRAGCASIPVRIRR